MNTEYNASLRHVLSVLGRGGADRDALIAFLLDEPASGASSGPLDHQTMAYLRQLRADGSIGSREAMMTLRRAAMDARGDNDKNLDALSAAYDALAAFTAWPADTWKPGELWQMMHDAQMVALARLHDAGRAP